MKEVFTIVGPRHVLTSWSSRASRCGIRGSSSKMRDTDTFNTSGRVFDEFFCRTLGIEEWKNGSFVNARVHTIRRVTNNDVNRIMFHKADVECVLFSVKESVPEGKKSIFQSYIDNIQTHFAVFDRRSWIYTEKPVCFQVRLLHCKLTVCLHNTRSPTRLNASCAAPGNSTEYPQSCKY